MLMMMETSRLCKRPQKMLLKKKLCALYFALTQRWNVDARGVLVKAKATASQGNFREYDLMIALVVIMVFSNS